MRHAEQLGYVTVSVGKIVQRAYEHRGRPGESTAAFVLRTHDEIGSAEFARKAVTELTRQAQSDEVAKIVVEGIHSKPSVRVVEREFGATDTILIHAPPAVRLARLRERDGDCSAAALLKRDLRELNSGLDTLITPSEHEFFIRNDGSIEAFRQQLDTTFE